MVDDDRQVCEFIADALQPTQMRTVCVTAERDAFAAIPTLPTFKALIVDVNLSRGATGYDLARFAREVIPEIAVIYISGGVHEELEVKAVPDSEFLAKPFTPDELIDRLSERMPR